MGIEFLFIVTIALSVLKNNLLAMDITVDYFYSDIRKEEDPFPCTSDDECLMMNYTKCIDYACVCSKNSDCKQTDVIKVTTLGKSCNDKNITCHIDNAHCFNNTCVCHEGFVQSATKKTCLKGNRKLGEECIESIQCHSHSCYQHICSKPIALNESCLSTIQCNKTIEFSHCKNGKCICLERYIADEGKCYLISRGLLSPCEVDVQCRKNMGRSAKCIQKKCVCFKNHYYDVSTKTCVLKTTSACTSLKSITCKVLVFTVLVIKLFL